eukprot:364463-Chlamydomonas_euryale.AAC.6
MTTPKYPLTHQPCAWPSFSGLACMQADKALRAQFYSGKQLWHACPRLLAPAFLFCATSSRAPGSSRRH